MSTFRYPDIAPVGSSSDAGLAELGASWNPGGEGLTRWIDYIKFQAYTLNYNGSAILDSFKDGNSASGSSNATGNETNGDTVLLYMPANVAASYSTSYNQTAFGVGGIMAAQMLGSTNSTEIAGALKNAAAGAAPEAAFSAVGDAISGINQAIGVGGSVDGNALAAVSQGRVFNPYEEQIFQGVSFRTHQFDFKLIARNRTEATQIESIVAFFKKVMLPSYNGDIGVPGGNNQAGGGGTAGSAAATNQPVNQQLNFAGSGERRYLKVPARLKVEFVRINRVGNALGSSSSGSSSAIKLFKFKDCVIESFQVNYTPDGGYINTEDGYVPALNMQMTLKEVALVTADDINQGY